MSWGDVTVFTQQLCMMLVNIQVVFVGRLLKPSWCEQRFVLIVLNPDRL